MKRNYRLVIVSVVAFIVVLVAGVGIAWAQDEEDTSTTSTAASSESDMGRHHGPGFGGHGCCDCGMGLRGEVVSVDGSTITLTDSDGEEQAVTVNDDTIYRNGDGEASLTDVVAGEDIAVKLTEEIEEGQEMIAEAVMIGIPEHQKPIVGEITNIDGNNVTINTEDGEQQVTLPSLEVGDRIGVHADEDGNVRGVMYDPPERPADS